ncbi:SigE family RNA polymerase sigma factor [Nocardioides sp. MAH-18]|uniref:SigE family RNA polymerase sigma factor n=1 Tax=Nocardioides agri TaxID=2682843 RepID=A0A6L6XUH9_9ACTN|nr:MULTISPECIES: SigE family RNA polymerase sigma factor [unclassified Nocardioides]MBA2955285.1 SigE family RNA polymerase sigma factor [Nocardioides sp. CGMCC 1.13656]MVQ50136.1 SigE family RNA polymerase sigma factor [Nocardioides sp. MAH-18]
MADVAMFDEFVVARSQALVRSAYLLMQDEGLAEDLVQTALTKSWFAWQRIDDPEAYVRRVMVTTATSWWRRRWIGETPSGERLAEDAVVVADPSAESQDLWDAIGRLPRRQRAVVVLRYMEDRTESETAELMGCSVGTVKSQCAKALAKLRVDPAVGSALDTSLSDGRNAS